MPKINPKENEILIRFSKYGKWESLEIEKQFEDAAGLYSHLMEIYSNKSFIGLQIDGDMKIIKR